MVHQLLANHGHNPAPHGALMVDLITPFQMTPSVITRYRWTNHSQHPCEDCEKRDGQIATLDQWSLIKYHKHCKCSLEPVEEYETLEIFNGDNFVMDYYNLDGSLSNDLPKAPICTPLLPKNPYKPPATPT
jgi:hypothetical protein